MLIIGGETGGTLSVGGVSVIVSAGCGISAVGVTVGGVCVCSGVACTGGVFIGGWSVEGITGFVVSVVVWFWSWGISSAIYKQCIKMGQGNLLSSSLVFLFVVGGSPAPAPLRTQS